MAADEHPPLTRIESWISEIVRKARDSAPPSGAEPLDLGELEGALRPPPPLNMPPTDKQDAA